jgi:hypothetical protein
MTNPRQIALVGDQSPEGDPYKPGDLVWWTNLFGRKQKATVARVSGNVVDVAVFERYGTFVEFASELSPRTDDCPEGTEK